MYCIAHVSDPPGQGLPTQQLNEMPLALVARYYASTMPPGGIAVSVTAFELFRRRFGATGLSHRPSGLSLTVRDPRAVSAMRLRVSAMRLRSSLRSARRLILEPEPAPAGSPSYARAFDGFEEDRRLIIRVRLAALPLAAPPTVRTYPYIKTNRSGGEGALFRSELGDRAMAGISSAACRR